MRRAVTVLCIALTIALVVAGIWLWQVHERKEAHIDWLMKTYGLVSYNCVAYDECTDSERKWMADCGKPSGNYRTPDPQADAVEDAYNKSFETKELEHRKQVFEDALVTGFGCASREDLEGMLAAVNRELDRRKKSFRSKDQRLDHIVCSDWRASHYCPILDNRATLWLRNSPIEGAAFHSPLGKGALPN